MRVTKFGVLAVVAMLVLSGGVAMAVNVSTPTDTTPNASANALQEQTANASVTLDDQTLENDSVTVQNVTVSEGGYVAIHIEQDGQIGQVVGTSEYLEAGSHENVTVQIDEGVDLANLSAGDGATDEPADEETTEAPAETTEAPAATTEAPSENETTEAPAGNETTEMPAGDETTEAPSENETTEMPAGEETTEAPAETTEAPAETTAEADVGDETESGEDTVTLVAMPHMETNDNETFDFVTSGGEDDGPYVADGQPVTDSAVVTLTAAEPEEPTANVTFDDQVAEGATFGGDTTNNTVVIENVTMSEGGYVAIHTTQDGEIGPVVGFTQFLADGSHEDVEMSVNRTAIEAQNMTDGAAGNQSGNVTYTLVAMPHMETNENTSYDFVTTNGSEDGPYVADGQPVTDSANVTFPQMAEQPEEPEPTEGEDGLVVESLDAPRYVAPNETVEVSATVNNTGSEEVEEDVAFRLEGGDVDVVLHETATVGAGETTNVTFEVDTTDVPNGEYIHGVTTFNSSEFDTVTVTDEAAVEFSDQESNGSAVVVDAAFLPEGGYVTIHDSTLLEGDALGSVVGTSEYLEAGSHENVTVMLDESVSADNATAMPADGGEADENATDAPGADENASENATDAPPADEAGGAAQSDENQSVTLIAMPHMETNDNETYDFVTSEGVDDGPYVADGQVVTDSAVVTLVSQQDAGEADNGVTDDAGEENETETPGADEENETVTPGAGEEETETPAADENESETGDEENTSVIPGADEENVTVITGDEENETETGTDENATDENATDDESDADSASTIGDDVGMDDQIPAGETVMGSNAVGTVLEQFGVADRVDATQLEALLTELMAILEAMFHDSMMQSGTGWGTTA